MQQQVCLRIQTAKNQAKIPPHTWFTSSQIHERKLGKYMNQNRTNTGMQCCQTDSGQPEVNPGNRGTTPDNSSADTNAGTNTGAHTVSRYTINI